MRKRFLLLLALLLGLLAACGQEQITADEIVRQVQQTIDTTEDLHAVVELSLQSPEQSGSGTIELWSKRVGTDEQGRPRGKFRVEVLEASEDKAAGAMLVSDAEQFWAYLPAKSTVYTGDLSELEALHDDDEAATDPLAAGEQLRSIVERGLEAFEVELLGEEEIAGHQAYKVKLTPRPDAQQQMGLAQMVNITVWIDQSRWLPLKLTADAGALGQAEATATTLETNVGVSEDRFVFTPPADAEVVDVVEQVKASQPRSVNLEEARQAAGFDLLEPAVLPEGVKLVSVQLINGKESGPLVAQVYAGNGIEFSLVQSQGEMPGRDRSEGAERQQAQEREVTVRGQQGRLVESQGRRASTLLTWEERGVQLAIAGRLPGDQALQIAEGLE